MNGSKMNLLVTKSFLSINTVLYGFTLKRIIVYVVVHLHSPLPFGGSRVVAMRKGVGATTRPDYRVPWCATVTETVKSRRRETFYGGAGGQTTAR